MTQSALVVDFGNYQTAAALVAEDQIQAIACPPVHPDSPLDERYLHAVITEAGRHAQARIDRLTLTIPTAIGRDEFRRAAVVALAAGAGFPDAELISDAVAAVTDPFTRPDLPDDSLVLVCDLGVSWSATLLRMAPEQPVQLAEETASESLTRAGLDILTDSALRWLIASCRAIVARAGASPGEIAAVVLVGGASRFPAAASALRAELGRPVLQPIDPEFAVIRGAVQWARQTAGRKLIAVPPSWRVEPLQWAVPERARLLRWLVAEGQSYPAGACVAQVRTPDDRVYDLTAGREGIMLEHRVFAGRYVNSDNALAMARSAMLISGDRPTKRLAMKVSGDWMLTPDRQYLVECADSGAYVRRRAIDTGAVVDEVRPAVARAEPDHGRVFVRPDGQLALVSWDERGQFAVWEVPSGRLVSQFRATARPLSVLVNEGEWRLVSEVDRKVNVGRYRRDVATMRDLSTGAVIEEMVGDDLQRRFTGFVDRSPKHGFTTEARSPNGRLRAGCTQLDGHAAVWLQQADTDEELFRAEVSTTNPVRSAFSADGHYLLNRWWSAEASCLDVWKI